MLKQERWPRRFKTRRITTRGASVYIIASPDAGCYKVGLAKRPMQRLDQLQIGSPVELKLMACTFIDAGGIDPITMERTLHLWLKPYNTHGEWFETTRQRMVLAWHQVAGELLEQEQKARTALLSQNVTSMECGLLQSDPCA